MASKHQQFEDKFKSTANKRKGFNQGRHYYRDLPARECPCQLHGVNDSAAFACPDWSSRVDGYQSQPSAWQARCRAATSFITSAGSQATDGVHLYRA